MHVQVDDWGEPVRLGPSEWEFESAVFGNVPVRVTHWRGKLVGVEYWLTGRGVKADGYVALQDPKQPWRGEG